MFSNNASKGTDFTDAMYYQVQKALAEGKNATIMLVNSEPEFASAWNNLPNGASEVIMIFHSNGRSIILEHGSSTEGYSPNGLNGENNPELGIISDLPRREIDTLYLLACNSGIISNRSFEGDNLGEAFSRIVDGSVIAVDGNVSFGAPDDIPLSNWIPFLNDIQLVSDEDNVYFPRLKTSSSEGYVEYSNGELVEILGGLSGPVEAYFQWAMMHSGDIEYWRNH